MTDKLWPQLALGLLAVGGIVVGLLVVGGPETARMEKRDALRLRELQDLNRHVICLARAQGNDSLPESLDATKLCPTPLRDDALLLSEGYVYEPLDESNFQLCATFEDIDRLRDQVARMAVDAKGCVHGKIN